MQSRAKTYARAMVQALEDVSEVQAKERIRRLKLVLRKRGDAKRIGEILHEFVRAWKERKGKIATMVGAQVLSDRTKKEMATYLEKSGYALEEQVDPVVIGGAALYLGNEFVIDATVRGKLQRLARNLRN